MITTRSTGENETMAMTSPSVSRAESFEIRYMLRQDDATSVYDECLKLQAKKATKAKLPPRQMAIVYALTLLCALPVFLPFANTPIWPIAALFAFSCSVAFLYVCGSLVRQLQMRIARRNFISQAGGWENWVSETFTGINADGIYKHSSRSMQMFFWNHVEDVTLTEKNIVVFLNPNTIPNMLFIPRRAFGSDDEAKDFVGTALELKRDAHSPEAVKR